ncbi:hypothetical protein MMC18_002381 [Xylographa bjoerkii]|nr:hypothetical protein [Xylographa bjoerkii]
MSWPYRFDFSLTPEQLTQRRFLLDYYGQLAQYSIIFPLLCFQVPIVSRFLVSQAQRSFKTNAKTLTKYGERPPLAVARGFVSPIIQIIRKIKWVLDESIRPGWGTWKQAVFGVLWGSWLFALVLRNTGDDYMHVTKRFGIVAASQLPLHYLLSSKPAYNPIQYLTRLSHEELNPYHRVFGYVLMSLFVAHATLYLNFYLQMGFLAKRIKDIDVQLGLACVISFATIATSAISSVRHYSYRIFYTLHITLSFAVLPILYFHVKYLRIYILETTAVYVFLVLQRYVTEQHHASATVSLIPNTSLMRICLPTTALPKQRTYRPGQHVYLSRPFLNETSSTSVSHMNPFSIANLPLKDSPNIELIVRELEGSTKIIADAARHNEKGHLNFLLEGPYGSTTNFPDLLAYDHVLFVAGGVGATFTMPIYRDLLLRMSNTHDSGKDSATSRVERNNGQAHRRTIGKANGQLESQQTDKDPKPATTSKLSFIWSVRTIEDATWGLDAIRQQNGSIPKGFELFVSGKQKKTPSTVPAAVVENSSFPKEYESIVNETNVQYTIKYGRPQMKSVVEKICMRNESQRVAVLVCGPATLGRDVRREVGKWIWKGQEVWWHEEQFSW